MPAIVELTQAEYARHRGQTPRAIDKAIAAGRIPRTAVRRIGRAKLIDVAVADRALGESRFRVNTDVPLAATDPAGENFSPASSSAAETPGLTIARTDLANIQARRAQLDLEERLGLLVKVEDVRRSMEICAGALARDLDQLSARCDDLATAFTRSGVDAMRGVMRQIVRDIRGTIEANMKLLAADEIADSETTEDIPA